MERGEQKYINLTRHADNVLPDDTAQVAALAPQMEQVSFVI